MLDSYVLVLAGLLMLGGSIGDRYGRRNWMTGGSVLFGAGSVFGALASNIEQLIAARGVQGLGAALVLPATLSVLTNVFDRDERPKAIAIWTAVGGLGPAVGGYLVDRWDWSAAFAATFGITALVFGIIQGSEAGWTSPEIFGSFALAAVLLFTFAQVERSAQYPMLPLHFFKQKDFTGAVVVLGLAFFSAIVMFFFLVQYFQLIQGRSPFETGLMVLPNAGAIVLAAGIAQWALPKFGPRSIVSIGVSIMALGVVLFTTVNEGTAALSSISYIMVFGFGFVLASGFWFSVGFLGLAVVTSLVMLPKRSRTDQVIRDESSRIDVTSRFGAHPAVIRGAPVEQEPTTV
ncbi:MAG: DHA2 family multidrug resistance protein-like MFS transporter [Candidatus Poriferisodalaceae bacterium]